MYHAQISLYQSHCGNKGIHYIGFQDKVTKGTFRALDHIGGVYIVIRLSRLKY